jgi:hypothetical protein
MKQALDYRFAPEAAMFDARAGSEGDLETRIDEPPLPPDNAQAAAIRSLEALLQNKPVEAMLQLQSSTPADGTFLRTPSVLVLAGSAAWNNNDVQPAVTGAVSPLWTTSGVGADWIAATAGRHSVERLEGIGTLLYAIRGNLLFLANEPAHLAAALDRVGSSAPAAGNLTYAAGFRHSRESANYQRIMGALDFSAPGENTSPFPLNGNGPAFFSGNLASLSRVLSFVTEVGVTEHREGQVTRQEIVYRTGP